MRSVRGGATVRLAIPACLVALAAAPAAEAAQRYASPGGSGTECSSGKPCSLKEAVTKAASNDEVIVTAGSYSTASSLIPPFSATNVQIHGDLSGPRPRIASTSSGFPIGITATGGRLEYLELASSTMFGIAAFCTTDGLIDRVRATAAGSSAIGIYETENCVVRDSVARVEGANSVALLGIAMGSNRTGIARNVTALATGTESIGVRSIFNAIMSPGAYTLDLRNAIASGEGVDLSSLYGLNGPGNIVVANSNFDSQKAAPGTTITDAGGNQTAPPLFVNAAGGDYREAAGSPTIDAGAANQLGPLDFDGNPRTSGPAPDIGAFELVQPAPPAGQVQSLAVAPKAFRSANIGGAIASAKTKKKKAPVGTKVTYSLSAAASVSFTVERKTRGRKVKGKCRKQTASNKTKKKCPLYKRVKGGFTHSGAAGQNRFKFSGRLSKPLKPGPYRLVGSAGGATKRASFKIVK